MFSSFPPKIPLNEFWLLSHTYSLIHLSGKLVNKSKTHSFSKWPALGYSLGYLGLCESLFIKLSHNLSQWT